VQPTTSASTPSDGWASSARAGSPGHTTIAYDVDGDLVVKVGRERVDKLVTAGRAVRFHPMGGRPMRG
jgi:hypothetical protein